MVAGFHGKPHPDDPLFIRMGAGGEPAGLSRSVIGVMLGACLVGRFGAGHDGIGYEIQHRLANGVTGLGAVDQHRTIGHQLLDAVIDGHGCTSIGVAIVVISPSGVTQVVLSIACG